MASCLQLTVNGSEPGPAPLNDNNTHSHSKPWQRPLGRHTTSLVRWLLVLLDLPFRVDVLACALWARRLCYTFPSIISSLSCWAEWKWSICRSPFWPWIIISCSGMWSCPTCWPPSSGEFCLSKIGWRAPCPLWTSSYHFSLQEEQAELCWFVCFSHQLIEARAGSCAGVRKGAWTVCHVQSAQCIPACHVCSTGARQMLPSRCVTLCVALPLCAQCASVDVLACYVYSEAPIVRTDHLCVCNGDNLAPFTWVFVGTYVQLHHGWCHVCSCYTVYCMFPPLEHVFLLLRVYDHGNNTGLVKVCTSCGTCQLGQL